MTTSVRRVAANLCLLSTLYKIVNANSPAYSPITLRQGSQFGTQWSLGYHAAAFLRRCVPCRAESRVWLLNAKTEKQGGESSDFGFGIAEFVRRKEK